MFLLLQLRGNLLPRQMEASARCNRAAMLDIWAHTVTGEAAKAAKDVELVRDSRSTFPRAASRVLSVTDITLMYALVLD